MGRRVVNDGRSCVIFLCAVNRAVRVEHSAELNAAAACCCLVLVVGSTLGYCCSVVDFNSYFCLCFYGGNSVEFGDLKYTLLLGMVAKCAFIQLTGDCLLKGGKTVLI